VAGNPDGAVTVVEFFDYRCPYCKAVARDMIETLEAEGDVRIVFKEFPILGPDSQTAAKAALAADRQGKYLPFHQALMDHKGTLDRDAILDIAEELGLDLELLEVDMESPEVATVIARTLALAEALDIGGTPAFIIGDELVPGAVDMKTLKDLVAKARNG
jgi:protein-disulfide isomerase